MSSASYLTLFILRHGQASDYAKTDFDRPLTKKGQQQAAKKGELLKQKFANIDTIFCSSAIRTLETLEYAKLDTSKSNVFIQKELYLCHPEILLTHINLINHGTSALIIGHNPGLHQFAYDLLPLHPTHHSKQENTLNTYFPKCALAELRFSYNNWSEINWHQGSLVSYNQ